MKLLKSSLISLILLLFPLFCVAQTKVLVQGTASLGGKVVRVSQVNYNLYETYPACTVTIYLTGTTTLATIYSDSGGTAKSNPFTSDSHAGFSFFIISGTIIDVKLSGTGITVPFTLASYNSTGGGGGDLSSNTSSSTDNQLPLFSGTSGKLLKLSTSSGVAELTAGILSTVSAPTGAFVGTTDSQTLTNKTIDASLNTITNVSLATMITGNLAVSHLNSGTGANSSSFWRGDGTWATISSGGAPAGSSGDLQKNSGSGTFSAASANDNGSQFGLTEPLELRNTNANNISRFTQNSANTITLGMTFSPPPAVGLALIADGTGNCTVGVHQFKITYKTAGGETTPSAASSITCDSSHTKVTITVPTGTTQLQLNNIVTARNIYATTAGGSTFFLIATSPVLNDNTTTSYIFNIADGSFTATQVPTTNTAFDTRWFVDNFGNLGIGTTTPNFVDDVEAKIVAIDGGTEGYAYLGLGTHSTGVNDRVGGLMFFNISQGGVDHRTAAIFSFIDGSLGTGDLEFFTSFNNVGPVFAGSINHTGDWGIGIHGGTGVRLQIRSADNTSATFIQSWSDGNDVQVGYYRSDGRLQIGNGLPGVAGLNVGTSNPADFQVGLDGKIASYAGTSIGGTMPNGALIIGNNSTGKMDLATLTAGSGLHVTNSTGTITLSVTTAFTPSSSADSSGTTGDITYDASFLYIKTGSGWRKVAIASF